MKKLWILILGAFMIVTPILFSLDFNEPITVNEYDVMPIPDELWHHDFDPEAFYRMLNRHRADLGLSMLRPIRILEITARRSSEELGQKGWYEDDQYNHRAFPLSMVYSYICYYTRWEPTMGGENLAMSSEPMTEQRLLNAWLNSPPHEELLERPEAHLVGVGCLRFRTKYWYTLHVYDPFTHDNVKLIDPSHLDFDR